MSAFSLLSVLEPRSPICQPVHVKPGLSYSCSGHRTLLRLQKPRCPFPVVVAPLQRPPAAPFLPTHVLWRVSRVPHPSVRSEIEKISSRSDNADLWESAASAPSLFFCVLSHSGKSLGSTKSSPPEVALFSRFRTWNILWRIDKAALPIEH